MSPRFRVARADEVSQAARLVAHSFPGPSLTQQQWEERLLTDPRRGPETTWVGEDANGVVAMCELFRFREWIAGEPLPIMGLAAVAIAPTHRRRGLAAELVTSGFESARERGDVASALYPFRTGFYQRLGYGMAGEALQYDVPPEAFPDAPERDSVRLAVRDSDFAALASVYDAWARTQTGQLERYPHSWDRVLENGASAVLFANVTGAVEGYLVFRYETGGPAQRRVEVLEGVWLTPAARRGLHGWLSSLGDQWRRILFRAHPDDGIAEVLRELRHAHPDVPKWANWFPSATLHLGPMFRILDLERALPLRRVAGEAPLTLGLEVRDDQLPLNDGSWRLRAESGSLLVERGGGARDATLSLRIDTLSRLFVGALAPSAAVKAELATIDRPQVLALLDRMFLLPRPWTFDRF